MQLCFWLRAAEDGAERAGLPMPVGDPVVSWLYQPAVRTFKVGLYGDDLSFLPVERQFLYMPFEHSEDLADQDLAADRMRALEAFEQTRGLTRWAERHRDIIRRFGRFPHRNALLGRPSTAEEEEFLKQPGSSF